MFFIKVFITYSVSDHCGINDLITISDINTVECHLSGLQLTEHIG